MIEQIKEKGKKKIDLQASFFWASYLVLLGVSTPHMAYFFDAFTDASLAEHILSYLAACVIEASIYIASFSVYKILSDTHKMNAKKGFTIFLLILWTLFCIAVSWLANSAHAAHFANKAMLSGTGDVPLSGYFQYLAGSWPIFGLIYSFASKIATTPVFHIVTAPIIDLRTPEQIIADSEKQRALLIANANLERTKSEIQGKNTRARLKNGLGGTIGGTLSGIKAGFTKEEIEENGQLKFEALHIQSQQILEDHTYANPEVVVDETSNDPYGQDEYDGQLNQPIVIGAQFQDYSIDNIEEDTPGREQEQILDPSFDAALSFMTTTTAEYDLWPEVRIVNDKDVKYSSIMPFFKNKQGVVFTSIQNAYQKSNKRVAQLLGSEYAASQITPAALEKLIAAKKVDPKYLRYVKRTNSKTGKVSYIMTIAIHESVRDEVLSKLLEMENVA